MFFDRPSAVLQATYMWRHRKKRHVEKRFLLLLQCYIIGCHEPALETFFYFLRSFDVSANAIISCLWHIGENQQLPSTRRLTYIGYMGHFELLAELPESCVQSIMSDMLGDYNMRRWRACTFVTLGNPLYFLFAGQLRTLMLRDTQETRS